MAGGAHAAEVCCFECLEAGQVTRAKRVHEGIEDDQYECEAGHHFGIDWSRGEAEEPQWPPPQELIDAFKKP